MTVEIDNRVTGKTRILGIVGNPIGHTISPQLHNTISKHLNIDTIYVPFKVEKDSIENAIKGLKTLNIAGFNVTVPFKQDVMQYLDKISEEAQLIGAVNTVKNVEGKLYGYNTDAEGFSRSFKEEVSTGFKGKNIVIIGAGGASRAIAVKVTLEGAANVIILNRTKDRAAELSQFINQKVASVAQGYCLTDHSVDSIIGDSEIIINSTSVGMYPQVEDSPLTRLKELTKNHIVYDAVYNPPKTRLLLDAEMVGCKVINGLGMLFYQGINAYEIWMNVKLSHDDIKDIYQSFIQILKK